jgi:membrane protein YqaA with SNARE-associated domain
MTNWAAIVYGRTYEIDFRLLALPVDFTQSEQDWLIAHIQTMTRYPEDLSDRPRWAVFRQDTLCIFMVACMARDLVEHTRPDGMDLTHDRRGRALYTVVGYATRLPPREPVQLPAYLDRDLRELSSTYQEYVAARWQVKSYIQDRATVTEYQPLSAAPAMIPVEIDRLYFALNITQPNTVVLWPEAINYRQVLWAIAAQQLATGQNVSLCLGLPTLGSAVNGAFLNGTAVDVVQKEEISRLSEGLSLPASTNVDRSVLSSKPTVTRRQLWIITLLLLAGSLIGGTTGLLVSKSLSSDLDRDKITSEQDSLAATSQKTKEQSEKTAKMALNAGLGAIAGSVFSLVVGMYLLKKLAHPTSSATRVTRKQAEQEDELNQTSTQRDPMFGFREKEQQNEDRKDNDIMTWG